MQQGTEPFKTYEEAELIALALGSRRYLRSEALAEIARRHQDDLATLPDDLLIGIARCRKADQKAREDATLIVANRNQLIPTGMLDTSFCKGALNRHQRHTQLVEQHQLRGGMGTAMA